MTLGGLPFSLISFNDDTDPAPCVRDGRVAVALDGGFGAPMDDLEMDGVLRAASVIEARGRMVGLRESGSGEETIEALDGGLFIAEAGGFETDDERVGLVPGAFLSAVGWTLGVSMEVLRV